MKNWFRVTFTDGTCQWLHSNRGWSGLIPYIAKLPNEPKYNGATVCTIPRWEGLVCYIRMILGDENCEEV